MAQIILKRFDYSMEKKWDQFVLEQSANGTFLQTRLFLNYHPVGKFLDNSLVFLLGNEIIAVVPGNTINDKNGKEFISHGGSTFGGIIIHKNYIKVSVMEELFDLLNSFFISEGFCKCKLKQTSELYSNRETELLDYYYFNRGYSCAYEVGYYIDYLFYNNDIPSNFANSAKRNYKNSLKNELSFVELREDKEIAEFYSVLCDNYRKFGYLPVHSLEDLIDLKRNRFPKKIRFFGVYFHGCMVSGSMVFDFNQKVFHTQYLAGKLDAGELHVNEFLYTNLISTARNEHYPFLSFGTATLDGGEKLNYSLAQFKEKFGTRQYINKTYIKEYV